MRKPVLLLLVSALFSSNIFAQLNKNRKKISTTRVTKAPKIDGNLTDEAWKNAEIATNFFEMRPDNGKPANKDYKTEVKVVYDDDAIYISAMLSDPHPNKIPMEFSNRDNIGQADFFLVTINPNDDGQNPFEFIVQSTGNQADAKVSNGNEDFNWSAVWDSGVKVTDKGWSVEMKIPYRALRFANEDVQSWGFNFHRKLNNLNSQYTWNNIDNTKGNWTQYDGLIENFRNISPPTRLNLYPYASATTKTYNGETDFAWSAGMDVKYGLSENFTLDATLIPDFSQAGFDNVELNLGPFEQQFSEQRQFFTEGTELFTKGNLFYSRRIGGYPVDQFDVESQLTTDEEISEYPEKVNMINAVKISGRTKSGLGIGFFNAITEETEATITDTITKSTRKLVTNPFSNYNILVLDQQFNQNSALTLINTNVTRDGHFRDANTTGLLWHVEDKKSTYNIDGSFKTTHIRDDIDNPTPGYAFDTSIGKHGGNWRGEIGYNFENKDYNPNDMGILFSNNEQTIYGFVGYRLLKPKGIFNNYGIDWYYNVNFQHKSGIYTGTNSGLSFWSQTKKRFGFGANLNYSSERKDFFEPRQGTTSGIYFERPMRVNVNHWGSTDYRKKFAIDYDWYYNFYKNHPLEGYGFGVSPRYRFSNQFSLVYGFNYGKNNNDQGYIDEIDEDDIADNAALAPYLDYIVFGERDRTSYNNTVSGKYSFSIKSSLSLTFRHNWTKVLYDDQYYRLQNNGSLADFNYSGTDNVNFNSWNLDLNYVWQFAPGSQLIAFYRNSINPDSDYAPADISYAENLDKLFKEEMEHTFSLRVVYFIDYNRLKNVF
ncbi:carbohydrate binding protein with CBM9 domain [Tenacibaculum adriaticum]|uniref:Carbohydrate binding protein with CBM9 domain n=1 Tax=Tenacibaculum adriaticum TaxID=413713 RepID=A0A5S5DQS2_9FLAO|nr:DUF5916 domain-containing protein [Tenacibaculum adriaticum]TYP98241.1 carbohydrate binding protein with CBM9 domain [Tenacibaculum adriaticum]